MDWAEEDDDGGLPPRVETDLGDGLTKIVEWGWNDAGYAEKTTKTVRRTTVQRKVSKGVKARSNWTKFGDAKRAMPGLEKGISTLNLDPVIFEWVTAEEDDDEPVLDSEEQRELDLKRIMAMDNFNRRREERKQGVANWAQAMAIRAGADKDSVVAKGDDAGGDGPAKYVPPSKRRMAAGEAVVGESMHQRDDSATVRVSNVPPNTTEVDLQELFRPFGPIRRTFLSRDRVTGESKGFAFVAFHEIEDARQCIEKLDGYGYDHLILRVEWSKSNNDKPGGPQGQRPAAGGGGGGFNRRY